MQKISLSIKGMKSDRCEVNIINELKKIDGIYLVNISFATEIGEITFDESCVTAGDIVATIRSLGYTVKDNVKKTGRKGPLKLHHILIGVCIVILLYILISLGLEFIINEGLKSMTPPYAPKGPKLVP